MIGTEHASGTNKRTRRNGRGTAATTDTATPTSKKLLCAVEIRKLPQGRSLIPGGARAENFENIACKPTGMPAPRGLRSRLSLCSGQSSISMDHCVDTHTITALTHSHTDRGELAHPSMRPASLTPRCPHRSPSPPPPRTTAPAASRAARQAVRTRASPWTAASRGRGS